MIRPLAVSVAVFGVLVIAGGAMGAAHGSPASLYTAAPLGLATIVSGVAFGRGASWGRVAAIASCAAISVVMLSRWLQTQKTMPAVPVLAAGLVLTILLLRARPRSV